MNNDLDELKEKVHYAASNGMGVALCELLTDLPSSISKSIMEQVVEDDGQKCTSLIIAARNGHEKVVRTLLKFNPNLEEEGTVKFGGFVIEGASALWCAAGAGHLGVVKMLVRSGADVNHPTKTNSTPLRAACFDGRLDIVQYLTEHNADINITNKYNNTCLMIAAYKGHLAIVQFLLQLYANPNEKANCGATALHFAAECGHVAIVKELLEHSACITKNEHSMTPLMAAAERTRWEVVEFFMTCPETAKEERIDALELLGASFASDKDNYNIESAFKYLMKGMKERYSEGTLMIPKPPSIPTPAYENRIECKTIEELQEIEHISADLHMESLVIRERILKCHNPEVPHPVIFRGAVFADIARFDRCLQLWLHALRLKQQNKVSVVKDLLRFAQVFSQMLHVGVNLEFEIVEEVLEATVLESERNCQKEHFPGPKDDIETIKEEIETNMITSLYLIMIALKILDELCPPGLNSSTLSNINSPSVYNEPQLVRLDNSLVPSESLSKCEDKKLRLYRDHELKIHSIVYKLVQVGAHTKSGQTLVHLAVNPDTPVDDFHTNHICKFPCARTTKLLIACGASVNDMDINRNTPLHLIVPYKKPVSDFLTLHNIILALIAAGAHMDTVNQSGATPMEAARAGVAEIILRTQSKISLMCQAARVVKKYGIPFKGQVPFHLEAFIELHGPGHVDSLSMESKSSKSKEHDL